MIKEYSLKNDGDIKLSEHFKVKEFVCKDGSDKILIDDNLIEVLESLRIFISKPIKIMSGYRTLSYNTSCGGSPDSQHLLGKASDIQADVPLTKLAIYAAMMGARGIGIYTDHDFVHIDTRDNRVCFRC